jgi:molybdenum cofactor cytidylyltransferase
MGRCKQLLPLDGRPVIVRVLESLLAAGPAEVIVVTSPAGSDIEAAVAHLPVTFSRNGELGSDMVQSIRVGLARITPAASGVLVCLADTPLVASCTYRRLLEEHRYRPDAILIPSYQGRRGHPILIPCATMAEIYRQPTLRNVVQSKEHLVYHLDIDDSGVLEDMDTPEDYRRIASKLITP